MKAYCPMLGIEYSTDGTVLSHKKASLPHPLFHVPNNEFLSYLNPRYWQGYSAHERSILATVLFRKTECVAPESAPFMLPAPLVSQYWGRFYAECEWLLRLTKRNIALPVPNYRFDLRNEGSIEIVFKAWLPNVEVIHDDFRNGVTYAYEEDAVRARVIAAQRRMSKKMALLEERHGQLPPQVVKYILDTLVPELPQSNPAHLEQQKRRRAYMLCLMLPDVKLLAAVHAKQVTLEQCLKLLDMLELWQLHDGLRYKTLRILRHKIEFLADMTNLVLTVDDFVGDFVAKFHRPFTVIAPSNAPDTMPNSEDYGADKLAYLRAMAAWRLKQRATANTQSAKESNDGSN